MPANLPPQYFDVEKRYRLARTTPEKIAALEEMLRIIPKHKGTEKLQGELKRRISKLRQEPGGRAAGGRRGDHFFVEKFGAGQVAMAGPPNSGKSSLMRSLTNATPEVADYPFTTRSPQTGMMAFENVRIQLVDLPPIMPHVTEPWVFAILRNADLLWIVVDLSQDDLLTELEQVLALLEQANIPLAGMNRKGEVDKAPQQGKGAFLVGNKLDAAPAGDHLGILREFYGERFEIVPVSARSALGIAEVMRATFRQLHILRAYTKTPGREPDLNEPVVLPLGSTVLDFAEQIHKDFVQKLKFARIWGRGKHEGQRVHREFPLTDGDILELHI
jgi:hypothetical protein